MHYERHVITNPPYENSSHRTRIVIGEDLTKRLEELAIDRGHSRSLVVQAALDAYLRKHGVVGLASSKAFEAPLTCPHDVFVCHSSKDKLFARRLASDLESRGYKVWFDEFEMLPGDSLYDKIQHGIKHSSWFLVVLSPHSVESKWCKRELHNALEEEFERDEVYVVPVLYKSCNVPGFLKEKVWADFQGKKYKNGLHHLLKRLPSAR